MSKAILLMVFLVGLLLATEARAQDSEAAAASPAPSPDVGAGFLVTYAGSFVYSSLIFSLVALFSH
ncbi:hypothetical protein TSUD_109790 [Trifolium subterraneum]|uniref:Uncharacterized protein n=1 Tax=Trifolium subterraneum TaxID=3900 RepID=A0A2Z6M5Y0_TRISU|nr:hypothetical protein TSUD_109790 [Trifolium subterraneum]